MDERTFGRIIEQARKRVNLNQKELAACIRKEDGQPISPQYLNDIERDRRNPPSAFFLEQFAIVLDIPSDVLYGQAGILPEDIKEDIKEMDDEYVVNAFNALRKVLRGSAV